MVRFVIKMNRLSLFFVLLVYFCAPATSLKEGECEVCIGVVNKLYKRIPEEDANSPDKIRQHVIDFCKTSKTKENSLCYVLGGLEESATGILNEITKPMSYPMPAEKVCEKLRKKDPQICELRYDKQIDLSKVELKKLKVRDLKKILADWGEFCDGCLEKGDYVKRIEDLKHLHVREEL